MMPAHRLPARHPPDELLLDYAVGSLSEAPALVVAAHLALCPDCRGIVSGYEAMGGALLEAMDPSDLSAGALEAVLDRIGNDPPGCPPAHAPEDGTWGLQRERSRPPADGPAAGRPEPPVLPEPLRGYAGGDVGSLGWKKIAEGVEEVDLRVGREGVRTRLLRLPGGAGLPGPFPGPFPGSIPGPIPEPVPDLVMVLAGALADERGLHRRGDVLLSGPGPVASAGEGCICIVVSGERLCLGGPAPPLGF